MKLVVKYPLKCLICLILGDLGGEQVIFWGYLRVVEPTQSTAYQARSGHGFQAIPAGYRSCPIAPVEASMAGSMAAVEPADLAPQVRACASKTLG